LGSLNSKVGDDLPLLAAPVSKFGPGTHRQAYGLAKDPRQAAEWVFKAGYDFSIKQMTENASDYTKQSRREFQRLMNEPGVYDGRIDGSFGPGMRQAIEALPASG
jgi:hypothetical protein